MFGRRLPLMRLFGFEVRFDLTWIVLLALVVWSLSVGYFPARYEDLPAVTYFWMAVLAVIGLVLSIVVHELSHSIVARRFGMNIRGITLFMFGGAAELEEEPPTPKAEFFMAIIGPVVSFVLAFMLFMLAPALAAMGVPEPIGAVVTYLAGLNLILAVFNLAPAFPLDGGRALRAGLWWWRGDLRWATRVAASAGGIFGLLLILLGVWWVFSGHVVSGMWAFLIGLFIRAAAAASYQRLLAREVLGQVSVANVLAPQPVTASANTSIESLVEDYFLRRDLSLVPVVDEGRLVGLADVRAAKNVPRELWQQRLVRDVLTPVSTENTISPNTSAISALELLQRTGQDQLLVADGEHLRGTVSLRALLNVLALRLNFGDFWRPRAANQAGEPLPRMH